MVVTVKDGKGNVEGQAEVISMESLGDNYYVVQCVFLNDSSKKIVERIVDMEVDSAEGGELD